MAEVRVWRSEWREQGWEKAVKAEVELCWGTVRQAGLVELIDVAGRAGFDAITVSPEQVFSSGLSGAELRSRLADAGVRITNLDALVSVLPGLPGPAEIAAMKPYGTGLDVRGGFSITEDDFYRVADLSGAESINVVHFCGDPATPLEALAEALSGVTRRAAARSLVISLEFLPGTAIPDIGTAARLVEMVGAPNLGIMFDTRHLARSGGTVEDLARHAALVAATQFSDLRWTTRDDPNRLLPGEGDLPLGEMLALVRAAKPGVPIGIEVFSTRLYDMPAAEAAALCAASMDRLLASEN